MRNLGLALVLIGTITAPHAAMAKKHVAHKKGRAPRALKPLPKVKAHALPERDDALADAVTAHKKEEGPVMTSTTGALSARNAAPVVQNQPMTMSNQDVGDLEVPGS